VQYATSQHGTGTTFERAATASCAGCHSHEGFVERLATGAFPAAGVENPTPVNCRTCHLVHETYTSGDLALRTEAPFNLLVNGASIDIGEGNLCAQCHQSNGSVGSPVNTVFTDLVAGTGYPKAVTSSTTRFGPHHGPQSAVLTKTAGYEFTGETYGSSSHGNATDGCVDCHMAAPVGNQAGGHTWRMEFDDHGTMELNVPGCYSSGCHDVNNTPEDDLRANADTQMAVLWDDLNADGVLDPDPTDGGTLATLKARLITSGILDGATELAIVSATLYPADVWGALWNYQTVREDRSRGLHNFSYARKLVSTSITAMDAYIATLP
jgi:hypothetical protein